MSHSDLPLEIPPNDPPDWESHPADLLCPLCKYNLRHLTVARCPECGFKFSWQELLEAEKNKHKYVFEHGRGHNFKSFWRTYWRTCQPRRFWSDLSPAQPVMLFRLMLYWVITAGILAIGFSGQKAIEIVNEARDNMAARAALVPATTQAGMFVAPWGSNISASEVDLYWQVPWHLSFWRGEFTGGSSTGLGWAVIFLIWPWVTLMALIVFRMSMRQAKILRVHLLRTVIYSCDFGFLLGIVLIAFMLQGAYEYLAQGWIFLIAALICSLITTYRLTIAFRQYLRVHLPFATVLVSQIIALLVVFELLTQIADFSRRI